MDLGRAGARTWVPVVVTTALALALRVLFIGDKSIWADEGVSILIARLDWRSFVGVLMQYEANMGLYYVLLRLWVLLGDSEAIVRSLSLVCAVAAVPVLYLLGTRLFGRAAGLTAALLLALNTFHIEHAQSARGYSLVVLLVALSSVLFVKGVESPSRRPWIAYVLVAALAVYSHFFAALLVLSQWVSVLFFQGRRRVAGTVASAILGLVVMLVPLILFLMRVDIGGAEWLRRPGWRAVAGLFAALSGGKALALVYAALTVLALAGLSAGKKKWPYAFVLTTCFLPIIIALYVSLVRPAFAWRYLIVSLPSLILIAAAGLEQVKPFGVRLGALVFIAVLAASSITAYYRTPSEEDWRGAVSHVVSNAKPGDAVFIYAGVVRGSFDYYQRRLGGWTPPVLFPPPGYWPGRPASGAEDRRVRTALEEASRYERVWLVLSHDQLPSLGRPRFSATVQGGLEKRFGIGVEKEFRRIRVRLFSHKK